MGVCRSCVWKLALKLVKNHPKLDLLRALELAEKGVERVKKRPPIIISGGGNPSDYTQPCIPAATHYCQCTFFFGVCIGPSLNECNCECPPPLANSHQVADNCVKAGANCNADPPTCSCYCSGCGGYNCEYDCDVGFIWNGVACVPAVVAADILMDGFVFIE